jgi:hypothetical protein
MFDRQVDLEKVRGPQKLAEIGATQQLNIDTGAMAAFRAAVESQADMLKGANQWVKSASAAVRPLITYWLWVIYSVALATTAYVGVRDGMTAIEVTKMVVTPDFMALLMGITNYWFLDRTLAKRGMA